MAALARHLYLPSRRSRWGKIFFPLRRQSPISISTYSFTVQIPVVQSKFSYLLCNTNLNDMTIKELQQSYIFHDGEWSTPTIHTNGLLCLIQQYLRAYDDKQIFYGYEQTTSLLSEITCPCPKNSPRHYFRQATKVRIDGFDSSKTYYVFTDLLNMDEQFYA